MAIWRPTLIPRQTLSAERVEISLDSYNRPTEVRTPFNVENAGVQPASGHEQLVLPEGFRDKVVYRIFTTTFMRAVKEGTNEFADRVELFGEWFVVCKVYHWQNGVQSHYEVIAAKEA